MLADILKKINKTEPEKTIKQPEENKLQPRSINKQRKGLFERTTSDEANQNK